MNGTAARRRILMREQNGLCYLCGMPMTLVNGLANTITVDHRIPKARRPKMDRPHPKEERGNITAGACASCNNLKWHLTEDEFRRAFPPGTKVPVIER